MPDDYGSPPIEFFEEMAKECLCCHECGVDVPCPGVCAGGICDHACRCRDDEPTNGGDDDDA